MVEIQKFIRLSDSKLFCVAESQIIFKEDAPTLGVIVLTAKDEFIEVTDRPNKLHKEEITSEEFNNNFKRVI
jgi:hypothetical protein